MQPEQQLPDEDSPTGSPALARLPIVVIPPLVLAAAPGILIAGPGGSFDSAASITIMGAFPALPTMGAIGATVVAPAIAASIPLIAGMVAIGAIALRPPIAPAAIIAACRLAFITTPAAIGPTGIIRVPAIAVCILPTICHVVLLFGVGAAAGGWVRTTGGRAGMFLKTDTGLPDPPHPGDHRPAARAMRQQHEEGRCRMNPRITPARMVACIHCRLRTDKGAEPRQGPRRAAIATREAHQRGGHRLRGFRWDMRLGSPPRTSPPASWRGSGAQGQLRRT